MNCKFCGKKIAKNSNFCPNCGKAVAEVKEAVIVEEKQEKINEDNNQAINNQVKNETKKRTSGVLASAIVVTALSLLTLSFIPLTFGIIAIVFACIYKSEMNDELAEKKKHNSLIMGIIAWASFGLGIIVKIFLSILFASLFAYLFSVVENTSPEDIRSFINDKIEWVEEFEPVDNYDVIRYRVEDKYQNITEIDYEGLKKLYNDENQSIVVLIQEKCAKCKIYKPILDELAKTYKLNIYYLDVNKMDDATYYEMVSEIDYFIEHATWITPTTLIVGNSKTLGFLEGYSSYIDLKNFLKLHSIIK